MRIIGVVDLIGGRAVHAVAGARERYEPVRTLGGQAFATGDAVALASGYRDRLGVSEIYCADLDAIQGGTVQAAAIAAIGRLGLPTWLDTGVSSVAHARRALDLGARRVVVGLETLPMDTGLPLGALADICQAIGGARVAFSIDLRHGRPLPRSPDALLGETPESLAAGAARAGAGSVIVLDLARVGTGAGLDIEMMRRVRGAVPQLTLLAGGGVRDASDLERLADAGCDGVLVATALHEGRLNANDVAAIHARIPNQISS